MVINTYLVGGVRVMSILGLINSPVLPPSLHEPGLPILPIHGAAVPGRGTIISPVLMSGDGSGSVFSRLVLSIESEMQNH